MLQNASGVILQCPHHLVALRSSRAYYGVFFAFQANVSDEGRDKFLTRVMIGGLFLRQDLLYFYLFYETRS